MDIKLRSANLSDFDECIGLLASPWLCDPSGHDALLAMWREIVTSRAGASTVAIRDRRIVHFGFVVFVSDERAEGYHRLSEPLIARRMLTDWKRGARPFQDAGLIARANAGTGLNLVVAQYGRDPSASAALVYMANHEGSRRMLAGWNIRSYTAEVFGYQPVRDAERFGTLAGFRVRSYAREQLSRAGIPDAQAPCVWLATREDAEGTPGLFVSFLFSTFAPPRCALTGREQEIVQAALDGYTDDRIAQVLGISTAAVKKNFRAIYDKAEDRFPDDEALHITSENGARGCETRRHLLNFVRDHPEELHPYDPSSRPASAHSLR